MAKINITIDDELLKKIELYCSAYYQTKSGFFSQCAIEKINSLEVIKTLKDVSNVIDQVAKTDSIDDNIRKEIDKLIDIGNRLLMVSKI